MPYKLLVPLLVLAAACSSDNDMPALLTLQDTAMTVPYRILVAGGGQPENKKIIEKIVESTFKEIDDVYNKWNERSEISAINRSPAGQPIILSTQLYTFLKLAQTYVKLTAGRFDPTIEPIQKLWKNAFDAKRLPKEEETESAAASVGWHKITLIDGCLLKHDAGVQLDLGGIVKGYAVDMLVERLNAAGLKDVFVEWGGEIRTSGRHPDNRPWKIYISRLQNTNPAQAIETIDMGDSAIATSGDYLQQWTIGKQTYFHIIDPRTKRPLQTSRDSIASVTVIAATCLEADVLATAAMVFPSVAEADEWAKAYPNTHFWIFSRASLCDQRKE